MLENHMVTMDEEEYKLLYGWREEYFDEDDEGARERFDRIYEEKD